MSFDLFEQAKVHLLGQGVILVAISLHGNGVEITALWRPITLRWRPTRRLRRIPHRHRGGAGLLSKQTLPVEEGKRPGLL